MYTKYEYVPFCFSASFFGSGWLSLPMQDAQSTTDLSFRFRTSRAESLLVLVAGRTDYCLVMLQAGAIKVSKQKISTQCPISHLNSKSVHDIQNFKLLLAPGLSRSRLRLSRKSPVLASEAIPYRVLHTRPPPSGHMDQTQTLNPTTHTPGG